MMDPLHMMDPRYLMDKLLCPHPLPHSAERLLSDPPSRCCSCLMVLRQRPCRLSTGAQTYHCGPGGLCDSERRPTFFPTRQPRICDLPSLNGLSGRWSFFGSSPLLRPPPPTVPGGGRCSHPLPGPTSSPSLVLYVRRGRTHGH
jgi:hypothetical protein